ncbi:hypothetical protein B0H63DRAFT_528254 [Podospora didyma]|uniref:Amine oxidase domain-containing protein n=1 Tax=Podospora didyma TaxID=330526 RepID=A0AAE0K5M3_9PEZI|nr:hypothetical protein B0H63DRAFT_528254 [Podospora didyma]
MEILPNKRCRPMKGFVLFKAPDNGEHHLAGTYGWVAGECPKEEVGLDRTAAHVTCPTMVTAATNSDGGGLLIPAKVARVIVSCSEDAIEEVQDLAATIPAEAAKDMSVLRALVNTKPFQDGFVLVPGEYCRTLGALFQSIENTEAAPLLAQTTEPGRPGSQPGVDLIEYAVDDIGGEQVFLQDGYVAIVDEIAKPLAEAGAIALDTVVTRVDGTRNPIVVETRQGNFTAGEVVCTFPLGVLKDSAKDELFNDEPYRSIKNGLIQTETTAQGEDDLLDVFLGFISELSSISIDSNSSVSPDVYRLPILNLFALTGQPVLCAFVSCKTATTVEGMKDKTLLGFLIEPLPSSSAQASSRPS